MLGVDVTMDKDTGIDKGVNIKPITRLPVILKEIPTK